MDESADVAGLAICICVLSIVLVRYHLKNETSQPFCKSLELHITRKDIFDCVDNYITKDGIGWDNCISVHTDGANAMTGKLSGAVSRT